MENHLFLLYIGLILLLAKVGGMIARKLGQPEVLGQLIMGVVCGLFLQKLEIISSLAEIGVVLLMFMAGLETDVAELRKALATSSLVALMGVVAPFFLVFLGVYFLFDVNAHYAIALGIIATATSVSISVQTLREIGKLKSREGMIILGAAIVDDVLGIIALTAMIGFFAPGQEQAGLGMVLLKIGAFVALVVALAFIAKWFFSKTDKFLRIEDRKMTLSLALCFLLAFASELLGVAAITGAYFAGVILSMSGQEREISFDVNKIASSIFIPIFFISTGMEVNLGALSTALLMGVLLFLLGSLGKIIGCGGGAIVAGSTRREGLQIGFGMIPRAEVAIIVANLSERMGFIDAKALSAVIIMVLLTTLVTPFLLKESFKEKTI